MPYRSISEDYKLDVCLLGTLTAAAEATPIMNYPMKGYDKALFVVTAGPQVSYGANSTMSTSFTVNARALQAKTSTGATIALGDTSALWLGSSDPKTVTGANVISLTVGSSLIDGNTITLNDVVFTFANIAATVAMGTSRNISSTDDPSLVATQLSSYINSGTYGCTGLKAIVTADSTVINTIKVYSNPFGEKVINSAIVVAPISSPGPVRMQINNVVGYLEIDARDLASSSAYTHVSIGVTPASSFPVAVTLIRGSGSRYSVIRGQYVQDYDDVI